MAKQTETENGSTRWTGVAKAFRLLARVTLTLAIVAVAAFAVRFGADELAQRANAAPPPEAAPIIPVATSPLRLEDGYDIERTFVGQVEPQRTVSTSFELPGRLIAIEVDEGDWVKKDQVLATQDTSLLRAERTRLEASKSATQAQLKYAEQTVGRSQKLTERGFASQAGLDEANARKDELLARIAEIEAGLKDVQIRMEKAAIRAPFDGRITERFVDGGETLNTGQSVLSLVAVQTPQVRIGVPLDFTAERLTNARIEVNGIIHDATLVTLRPDIDPVTRTRTALFRIDGADQLAFGQTARLILENRIEAAGLWLDTTSLKEGVRGQWTILTVGPDRIVRAAVVEVLHATSSKVFVRGSFPEGTLLIEDGPQRVTLGQVVQPTSSF